MDLRTHRLWANFTSLLTSISSYRGDFEARDKSLQNFINLRVSYRARYGHQGGQLILPLRDSPFASGDDR